MMEHWRALLCRGPIRAGKGIWRESFRGRFFQSPGRDFQVQGCGSGLGSGGGMGALLESTRKRSADRFLFLARHCWSVVSPLMEDLHRTGTVSAGLDPVMEHWRTLLCRGPIRAEKGIWRASFLGRFFQSLGREFRGAGCEVGFGTVGKMGHFSNLRRKETRTSAFFLAEHRRPAVLRFTPKRNLAGVFSRKVFPESGTGVPGAGT